MKMSDVELLTWEEKISPTVYLRMWEPILLFFLLSLHLLFAVLLWNVVFDVYPLLRLALVDDGEDIEENE